jgi:hypothetical protein
MGLGERLGGGTSRVETSQDPAKTGYCTRTDRCRRYDPGLDLDALNASLRGLSGPYEQAVRATACAKGVSDD